MTLACCVDSVSLPPLLPQRPSHCFAALCPLPPGSTCILRISTEFCQGPCDHNQGILVNLNIMSVMNEMLTDPKAMATVSPQALQEVRHVAVHTIISTIEGISGSIVVLGRTWGGGGGGQRFHLSVNSTGSRQLDPVAVTWRWLQRSATLPPHLSSQWAAHGHLRVSFL